MSRKHKIAVIGSGNWGSTIAKVVAENTAEHPHLFEKEVTMWVHEEAVTVPKTSPNSRPGAAFHETPHPLSGLINEIHENVKYLPNITLPANLVANPSIVDSVSDATIIIFNLPHQFLDRALQDIKGKILPYARAISCIKGLVVKQDEVALVPDQISRQLGIRCGALSGANIALEVALEKFCETTVAYAPPIEDLHSSDPSHKDETPTILRDIKLTPVPKEYPILTKDVMKTLFHRPTYFHVRLVSDVAGVSIGGALKNVIALAAGFVEGLGWGDNAKAAVMRVGILEMVQFSKLFFSESHSVHASTVTEESCGVADLITSCMGGRNFRCAREAIETGKSIGEVEKERLNGQKLQGTITAAEVHTFLKYRGMESKFPLLVAVYHILEGRARPEDIPHLIERPE